MCVGPIWIGYHGGMNVCSGRIQFLALAAACLFGGFAGAQQAPAAGAHAISFTRDVHPILTERCFKCHLGDEKRGGFSMNTRESLLAGGEQGSAVKPGDAENSLLIELVTSEDVKEDRKSTRLNSSHIQKSRMPSSA